MLTFLRPSVLTDHWTVPAECRRHSHLTIWSRDRNPEPWLVRPAALPLRCRQRDQGPNQIEWDKPQKSHTKSNPIGHRPSQNGIIESWIESNQYSRKFFEPRVKLNQNSGKFFELSWFKSKLWKAFWVMSRYESKFWKAIWVVSRFESNFRKPFRVVS